MIYPGSMILGTAQPPGGSKRFRFGLMVARDSVSLTFVAEGRVRVDHVLHLAIQSRAAATVAYSSARELKTSKAVVERALRFFGNPHNSSPDHMQ